MLLLLLFSCALSFLIPLFIRSTTLSHNNTISSTGTTRRTTSTPQASRQRQQQSTTAATAVKGFFNSIWTSIKSAVFGDDANDSNNTPQTTVQAVGVVPSSSTSSLIYQSLSNIFVHVPKLEPANCYITSLGDERKQFANNVGGSNTVNRTSNQQQQQQQQVYYANKVGPQEFLLHLMDDRSSPFGCLEDQIVRESDIHVSVTGGSFESLSLIETDDTLAANIRRVKFSIPISGWYSIHVKVMNCSIRNSPFRLYLEPDVVDPSKVIITGPMVNSIDGTILQKKLDAFIKLTLYDKYGNKVKATSALRDSISVLFNNNMDPNNPDFTARIVVNHPEENYIIRITPQKTGIHRMQVFYDVTNLVSKKNASSDAATHIQLFVLGKEGYKIFKSLDNNSLKLSFPVTLTKVKKDRVKKKDVYMIITNDTLQIVSYVLYFIPRVIVEFAVKHLEYEVDTTNQSNFTLCEASYKRRSCSATQATNASKTPKTLQTYHLSCPKRTLVIAILKALRTRPMKEIEMKLTLSHLFTNFDEYSEREVSQVYDVFAANEQSHQAFMDFFGTFLKMQGTQILSSLESSASNNTVSIDQLCTQLVDDLLYFYHKMLAMIDKYFAASEMLKTVLNKTFSEMIHSDISSGKDSKESSVSLFCRYCDHLMRTGQTDDQLDRIVTLFKLVQDKDVLQEMYRRQLALRLIARGTEDQSLYDERAMLVKLKMSFGLGFTCRMEGMARDIQANYSLLESFASHLAHKGYRTTPSTVDSKYQIPSNGITFKPLILTQGYWPSFSSQEIKPATSGTCFVRPREMDECIHEFTQFYRNHTHGGRTLTWLMSSGTVTITALFWSGEYELVLPTYLACVLLQFNRNGLTPSEPELSMKHIGESLNVPPSKIANFIKRLASPKLKLIKLKTATKTPATIDSLFVINGDFESNLKKIRVSESDVGPPVEKQVEQVVVRDRTFAIEAALVRIMKARKTMSHKLLLMECSKQMLPFFNPDVKMIKQRIDSLIEREFLSRDDDDITTLHYVA